MSKKKTTLITKAADLNADLLVAAYNDTALNNAQVVEKLNVASWDVVHSKARSLKDRLTLVRRGGITGTFQGAETPAPATTTTTAAATPAATTAATPATAAPVITEATTPAPAADAFKVHIKCSGLLHTIEGEDLISVGRKIMALLSEMKFKTVNISNTRTRAAVKSVAEFENGETYEARDQVKAAGSFVVDTNA